MNIDQNTLQQLRDCITLAEARVEALRAELQRKNDQIAAMGGEIERLQREIAAWESDDRDRRADEADLQAEVKRLRAELKNTVDARKKKLND